MPNRVIKIEAIDHLNKPLGINLFYFIRDALVAEMEEVSRQKFEAFVATQNFRRDLIGGIRHYYLVATGRLAAFYCQRDSGVENPRFFIEPCGVGIGTSRLEMENYRIKHE